MINDKKISIVIPAYEMHGFGVDFLKFNFDKIKEQTFKDFQVVVSDHSDDDSIKKLCDSYKNKFEIKYLSNKNHKGNSSFNVNNAIKNATGEIIKIIFQDDFLFHENSLMDIVHCFNENDNKNWLISSSEHTRNGVEFYNNFIPHFDQEKLLAGINTVSSPSVISFKKQQDVLFDENLVWLMDCDFYVRMFEKYGEPIILEKTNVVNRVWEKQFNNIIPQEVKTEEVNYLNNKNKK